jgi:hypothetical protein
METKIKYGYIQDFFDTQALTFEMIQRFQDEGVNINEKTRICFEDTRGFYFTYKYNKHYACWQLCSISDGDRTLTNCLTYYDRDDGETYHDDDRCFFCVFEEDVKYIEKWYIES